MHDVEAGEVQILEARVMKDSRGHFFEVWNRQQFAQITGWNGAFVQENQSGSNREVIRGLHYQLPPHPQGKLVRVVTGAVFDVAVDIRRSSAGFGHWVGVELSAQNRKQLWIPPGFAHGFLVTSEWAELIYSTTDYFAPECERAIRWDDPDIGIDWPLDGEPVLSEKDASAPYLRDVEVFA